VEAQVLVSPQEEVEAVEAEVEAEVEVEVEAEV
jgi:hypothetical protein